jgi:hypothetical protein
MRALDYFRECNASKEDRFGDALELLESKKRTQGTWTLQNRHPGETYLEMEKAGEPSRWNTLRALRILKWWYN